VAVVDSRFLSLSFSRAAAAVVVRVGGELDGYTAPVLGERLTDVIVQQGNLAVTVDLAEVSFLDSAGSAVLLSAYHSIRRQGGSLAVRNPSKAVEKVLTLSRWPAALDQVAA
jgi:anti-sigma B factor antagonist